MEKNRVDPKAEKAQSTDQEWIEMKLLTPLTADLFPEEDPEWEDDSYNSGETLDGRELAQYEDVIQKAVDRENDLEEEGAACNLMDYFDGIPSIKEKVGEALVSVENVDGILYGCTTLQLREYLEPEELYELCEYITGQYSDGWGEGFEQRDIQVDGGTLNVHFWQGEPTKFRTQTTEKKGPFQKQKRPARKRKSHGRK